MNRCTFNQTTKFTSLIPPHDEHFEQIQCENMTEEQFDEYNRAYCREHRIKVDEINKKRQQEFIKKLELIKCRIVSHPLNIIKECEHEQCQEIQELIVRLKLGDFDND